MDLPPCVACYSWSCMSFNSVHITNLSSLELKDNHSIHEAEAEVAVSTFIDVSTTQPGKAEHEVQADTPADEQTGGWEGPSMGHTFIVQDALPVLDGDANTAEGLLVILTILNVFKCFYVVLYCCVYHSYAHC